MPEALGPLTSGLLASLGGFLTGIAGCWLLVLRPRTRELLEARSRLAAAEGRNSELALERERLAARIEGATAERDALRSAAAERISELRQEQSDQRARYEDLLLAQRRLEREYAEYRAGQQERDASHAREVATFETQKSQLDAHFREVAARLLEQSTDSLRSSSRQTLDAVLGPFRENLEHFRREAQAMHHREALQQGELRRELETLKDLNQRITQEAHELATALRGQKKLQGNWGELLLENVLERCGLQKDRDYRREVSFSTAEGRRRPDAIVYLPGQRHLIIDAKVPLAAWTRYVNSEDDRERDEALREHLGALKARIGELSTRDYTTLPGLKSPELVFMFVPLEAAFAEALRVDESLFQAALEGGVLLTTPTTLLASLNIVRQLWRYERQSEQAAALAQRAESIHRKLASFLGSFDALRGALDKATDAYNRAEGQLVTGRANLVRQVADFREFAPSIQGELPAHYLSRAADAGSEKPEESGPTATPDPPEGGSSN